MTTKECRDVSGSLSVVRPSVPPLKRGVCHVMFAFELGLAINLDAAAQRLKQAQ